MFEQPLELEPKNSKKGIWVGAVLVVVLAVGLFVFLRADRGATKPAAAQSAPAVVTNQKADPVHDLQILSAQMHKDTNGTTADWVVDIQNTSPVYTYSSISYQTTYVGANNSILSQNTGVIPISVGPNEEQTAQFSDVQYPSGTAWYQFRVVNAKETGQ